MLMLCALCLVRSCHFEIEQPGSSTFIYFPYLTWMTRVLEKFIPIEVHRLWGPQLLIQVVWNPTFFVFSHACPKPRYPMKTLPSWMAWYGSRTAKSSLKCPPMLTRSALAFLPQEVGRFPLQKAFLQGSGEIAAGFQWCN